MTGLTPLGILAGHEISKYPGMMTRNCSDRLIVSVFAILVTFANPIRSDPAIPASPPPLPEKAASLSQGIRATAIGEDRQGNLWVWNWNGGRVDLYSPTGEPEGVVRIPAATDVDADRSWGVVAITGFGLELRIASFEDAPATVIPLKDRAQGVTWIDPNTVAVSPALAAHRVEIWDLRSRTVVRRFGQETPIVPGPGVTLLRNVLLHYDERQGKLYSIESFTGDVQIFSVDGKLLRHETIPKPDRTALEESMAQDDQERRRRNDPVSIDVTWYRMAVDSEGTFWSVQSCDGTRKKATFFKLPVHDPPSLIPSDEPCCNHSFTLWRGWFLLFPQPGGLPNRCNSVRRIP